MDNKLLIAERGKSSTGKTMGRAGPPPANFILIMRANCGGRGGFELESIGPVLRL